MSKTDVKQIETRVSQTINYIFMNVYCLFHLTDGPLQFCCNSQRLNTGSFGKDGQSSSSCTVSQNSKGELLTTIKQYFHRLQCINVSPDQTSVTAP